MTPLLDLFHQTIWYPEGLVRARDYLIAFALFAIPALCFFPRYFFIAATSIALAGTIAATGPIPILVVALFLWSATVTGGLLLPKLPRKLALLVGLAIFIFTEGILVRFPVNYAWLYIALMLLPLAISYKRSIEVLKSAAEFLKPAHHPRVASAALALILMAHWLIVLQPEVSGDGMAMHLAIPDGVAWKHRFAFDLTHNIWAVMPMGGDWCFTLVYLPGGEYAARLLNLAFFLLLAAFLYRAVRRFLGVQAALWITALFASLPMVQLVTGSLFIENVQALAIFGALAALWRHEETQERSYLLASAALFATAMQIKFGSLAFVIPGLVFLFSRARKETWKTGAALILVLLTGLSPYFHALAVTGNPVFPFLNNVFRSSALPPDADATEYRFREPLSWITPFRLVLQTGRYYEGQDGSFGFQFLLLLPVSLFFIRRRESYPVWTASIVAIAASLIILVSQPNARYLFVCMPLFHVTIAWLLTKSKLAAGTGLAVCLLLNLWFLPSSGWYHKNFYSYPPFAASGRLAYLKDSAPFRVLIDELNRKYPGEPVLFVEGSPIAGLRAPALRDHWHDVDTAERFRRAIAPSAALAVVRNLGVRHILAPTARGLVASKSGSLQVVAAACLIAESRFGEYVYGALDPDCEEKLPDSLCFKSAAGRRCDDSYKYILFTGAWQRNAAFLQADSQTLSYSSQPGAKVSFPFQGPEITYVFTKAFNRGIADVFIDGKRVAAIDEYAPGIQWQSRATYRGLTPGAHTIQIRVTGRKRVASADTVIDLDSFITP